MDDSHSQNSNQVDLDVALRLGTGIRAHERARVLEVLEPLEGRLRNLDASTLEVEAWVKNRGDDDQVVYLSVRATDTDLVAHDQSSEFDTSLVVARNDLRRQLTDMHDRRKRRR